MEMSAENTHALAAYVGLMLTMFGGCMVLAGFRPGLWLLIAGSIQVLAFANFH